jgi:hypothetical protein
MKTHKRHEKEHTGSGEELSTKSELTTEGIEDSEFKELFLFCVFSILCGFFRVFQISCFRGVFVPCCALSWYSFSLLR